MSLPLSSLSLDLLLFSSEQIYSPNSPLLSSQPFLVVHQTANHHPTSPIQPPTLLPLPPPRIPIRVGNAVPTTVLHLLTTQIAPLHPPPFLSTTPTTRIDRETLQETLSPTHEPEQEEEEVQVQAVTLDHHLLRPWWILRSGGQATTLLHRRIGIPRSSTILQRGLVRMGAVRARVGAGVWIDLEREEVAVRVLEVLRCRRRRLESTLGRRETRSQRRERSWRKGRFSRRMERRRRTRTRRSILREL